MSKVFYDHLIVIGDIIEEIEILQISDSEKDSARKMVDEIVHHQVLDTILMMLPSSFHKEFLARFHECPFALEHLVYLENRTDKNVKAELISTGKKIKRELSRLIKKHVPRHV